MRVLFFDTETTDLPDYKAPPGRHQPHIVQLAAVLVDRGDEQSLVTLIQPDGWRIHPEAQATHGITLARAQAEGIPIAEAIAGFDGLLSQADLAVAHNVKFDRLLVDSEYVRLGREARWPQTFCTMLASTDVVRLRGHWGGYRWPTLGETHRHFFGQPPVNAHDAMADVRACMAVFKELGRRGIAPRRRS
jgi:DNA polymerase III epsilon subunit-like protein